MNLEELRKFCPLKWNEKIPEDGVGMAIADIDFKGPKGLVSFLKEKLTDDYSSYGPFEGLDSAIETGKEFLQSRGISNINSKQIQIIPGTMMGIYAIMEWISRISGDVTIINPIYPPIHRHCLQAGNTSIRWVNLQIEDKWKLNHEELKEKIDTNTKLLVFNNPNNPTGSVLEKKDLQLISDLSKDFDFPVFVDELYYPLINENDFLSLSSLDMSDKCITLHGFSKTYGFAGWMSGFMHIDHPNVVDIKYIVEQLIVSPSPVTSLVMEYALTSPIVKAWQRSFQSQILENTKHAVNLFSQNDIDCIQPNGCFFVFPNIKCDDSKFKEYLLKEFGVDIVPGSEFGPAGDGFIRINCATSLEKVDKGIKRIIRAINEFNTY